LIFGFTSRTQQTLYYTKTGKISFFSSTPVEDIEATNNSVQGAIEAESGKMQFLVLMKAFQFEKSLMQEHFNENYVESHKYPKAKFNGEIVNIEDVDFEKDGVYQVKVKGELTIKNKTNPVETDGTLEVKGEQVRGKSTFKIRIADYGVKVPKIVMANIAEIVDINVDMDYTKK
jgi:hypothetical protein